MKTKNNILQCICFLALVIFFNSCKDKTPEVENKISYPQISTYGQNILALPDSTILNSDADYGLCASLEKDANLKIVITNFTNNDTVTSSDRYGTWYVNEVVGGFSNKEYEDNSQVFESTKNGII